MLYQGLFNLSSYIPDISSPYLRKRIDESDCIISIGVKLTDTITGGFTQGFTKEQVIEIHPYTVKITDKKYGPVVMKDVLQQLSDVIEHRNEETLDIKPFISESLLITEKFNPKLQMATKKRFWQQMYHFLQENDVLIAEQGTPFFGSAGRYPFTKQHYICSATIMGIDRLYITCSTWYTAR